MFGSTGSYDANPLEFTTQNEGTSAGAEQIRGKSTTLQSLTDRRQHRVHVIVGSVLLDVLASGKDGVFTPTEN